MFKNNKKSFRLNTKRFYKNNADFILRVLGVARGSARVYVSYRGK